eukprot:2434698-Rhodomonas_salina.1
MLTPSIGSPAARLAVPCVTHRKPIEFAFNSTVHSESATGVSPFWVSTGKNPSLPLDLLSSTIPTAYEFVASYATRVKAVQGSLYKAQDRLYRQLLRQHSETAASYKPGEKVWLSTHSEGA